MNRPNQLLISWASRDSRPTQQSFFLVILYASTRWAFRSCFGSPEDRIPVYLISSSFTNPGFRSTHLGHDRNTTATLLAPCPPSSRIAPAAPRASGAPWRLPRSRNTSRLPSLRLNFPPRALGRNPSCSESFSSPEDRYPSCYAIVLCLRVPVVFSPLVRVAPLFGCFAEIPGVRCMLIRFLSHQLRSPSFQLWPRPEYACGCFCRDSGMSAGLTVDAGERFG